MPQIFHAQFRPTQPLIRPGIQPRLSRVDAEYVARALQRAAVDELDKSLARRAASTGRLKKVLEEPAQIKVTDRRLQVFDHAYLTARVPYWQAIDLGSTRSVGRRLSGVWRLGGEFSPWGAATGQILYRSGSNSRVNPVRRSAKASSVAYQLLIQQGVPPEDARVWGRIRRPITAHHYMQAARRAFTPQMRNLLARQLARQYLRRR